MTARANLYYPQGDLLPLAIVEALGFRAAEPDSAAAGSAAPGSAAPGSAAPDSAAPGSAAPGSAAPGSAAPGSAAPGSAAPDSAAAESAAADSAAAESSAAGTPRPVVVQLGEARIELARMAAADRVAHLEALHDYLSNRCALQDPARRS